VEAIRRAAAGGTLGHSGAATEPTLTHREQEIVRLMVDGRSNDEIGAALSISRKTVEGHLSRLFARVGVASRAELAARAVTEGWLDVPTIPRRRPRRS
jgi:DNA-binding NarL/FixJ family response regulator